MTHDEMLTSEHPSTKQARDSRRWWGAVAAVAAGAVAAGSLGYAVGQSGETPTGVAPAIALATGAPDATSGGVPGSVGSGEPASAPDGGVDLMPYTFGRIVFTSSGLSNDPGATTAWAYDPGKVFSKQTAARVATALGLDGEPELVDGSWIVGSTDGRGPMLQLTPDGLASLSYYDPTMDPYRCAVIVPGGDGDSVNSSGTSGGTGGGSDPGTPPGTDCEQPAPDAPKGTEAIDRVKELFRALGVDASGYQFETADYGTPNASYVIGFQVVDGQRTGAMWNVTLVGRQVQSVYGGLAPLVSLGSYDVVSPTAAVGRLSDPRYGFGFFGGPMPYAVDTAVAGVAVKDANSSLAEPSQDVVAEPTPTLPPTIEPGAQFSWPVQEVTITKARLGLALYTQTDGSTVLLPTYELSDSDGQTWSVIAVDDQSLDFGT